MNCVIVHLTALKCCKDVKFIFNVLYIPINTLDPSWHEIEVLYCCFLCLFSASSVENCTQSISPNHSSAYDVIVIKFDHKYPIVNRSEAEKQLIRLYQHD